MEADMTECRAASGVGISDPGCVCGGALNSGSEHMPDEFPNDIVSV